MRTLVVAIAIFGMFATAAQAAADDSSLVVVEFPDTATNLHVRLFVFKKNNISLSPQEFCSKMDYGDAVLGDPPDEIGKDNKVGPGKLEWVICRFNGK